MYHPSNINNFLLNSIHITTTDILLMIGTVILIAFSAFFSSSETAFTSANNLRLRTFAEEKKKGARKAIYISEHYEKAITTILVGNNLVNIACTTICAYLFAKFILNPTLANILNTVILTVVILIFGEILPKSLAKANPEKYALRFSGVLHFIIILLTPICYPFRKLQQISKQHFKEDNSPTVTEDELEDIIDTMEEEGVIESEDADLIQNVIKIGEATAYDIMTPRVDMICASVDDTIDKVKNIFVEHQFSRLPIYKDTRDNIVGILNQKDLFAVIANNKKTSVSSLMTKPVFINENMKVDDIIKEIQKTKKHICIVLDEHGGTSGIVTMEDCLEEMVGEIYDEFDEEESKTVPLKKIDNNNYKINANMHIHDLFEKLEIENLPNTNYSTIAGFLFELSEDIPQVGDILEFNTIDEILDDDGNFINKKIKMIFKITKMKDKRITEVELKIKQLEEE